MATLWTLGHSTLTLADFVERLRGHQVQQVVDVRSLPGSRRYPHFDKQALGPALRNRRIQYRHVVALGGRRRPTGEATNAGWRNASFRGYADYMGTEAFAQALEQLLICATKRRVALLCAEAVYWRCHRSMIADALVVRGHDVVHIMGPRTARAHVLRDFAHVRGHRLTYP